MDMPMAATQLVTLIGRAPQEIGFQLVMDAVSELYEVKEVPFRVGDVVSAPGQNMGSAKVFSFASISKLDKEATLNLFGDYYRVDVCKAFSRTRHVRAVVLPPFTTLPLGLCGQVLENPEGSDHANIRAFMKGGWDAVEFPEGLALTAKSLF